MREGSKKHNEKFGRQDKRATVDERRTNPRLPYIDRALLKVAPAKGHKSQGDLVVQCTLVNASSSGLRIHADMALPPGTEIDLWLSKPGERGTTTFQGVVKWCHAAPDDEGYHAGVHLKVGQAHDVELWQTYFPAIHEEDA